MNNKTLLEAVDFVTVLLDTYKKFQITEMELVVILETNHLIQQGNTLVTGDLLSMKMNLAPKEIEKIIVSLCNKSYLSYEIEDGKTITSIDGLKNKIYASFRKSIQAEQSNLMNEERNNRLSSLIVFAQDKLGRTLTPLEMETLGEWIDALFKDEEIRTAILEAVASNKKNFRAIDKILRTNRKDKDFAKEGNSAVSSSWNLPVEETLEIAKKMWEDDD
ncbi:MAG: DnaD domain protein [Bacilli bacterium]|nr:DnaD domain protein [Bacilli bacterium]